MKVWPHPLDPDGPDPLWLRAIYVVDGVVAVGGFVLMVAWAVRTIGRTLGW